MIRLDDLTGDGAGLTTGQVFAREFDAFAHDSRNVRGGELFVAVRTSRADGHDFIADAVARGATGVIAEDRRDLSWLGARGVTLVTVDDVRLALRAWARRHLATLAPRVIAVTGTAGKTTTTKAIATVLTHLDRDHHAPSGSSTVFENDNYNDLLGLPLSLARLGPAHRHAVIELGTDRAGEISALTDLVRPGIAVVTGVIPDAEPFATDPETAIAEYLSILDHAPALAILNRDDARLHQYATTLNPVSGNTQFLWIGTHPEADIRATDVTATPDGLSMKVQIGREIHAVMVGLHGTHWVPTVLATVAVARHLGYGIEKVIDALASIRPVSGRLRPLSGTCGMRVIDDTFSATPASVEAAFNALEVFPRPRLVVLGDAGDTPLPASTVANLGAHLARVADAVIAHGDVADAIVRAARGTTGPSGSLHTVHTRADAVARIRAIAGIPADGGAERMGGEGACQWTVLVKGNARARMEGVVERLLANRSCATETLVRQTPGHVTGIVRPGHDRPAWVEIDLGAIASNLRAIRTAVAPASVMAVLKADAYGHGAVRVARTVLAGGATFLATAVLTEASTLREAGIDAPILVLGHTPPWQARTAVRLGVAMTLFDFDGAHHLSEAAIAYGRKVPVHLKVDTGLHRIGLGSSEVVAFARTVSAMPGLVIEGLYTHLATADDADETFAQQQLSRFNAVIDEWREASLPRPRYVHALNSAGALRFPEARFDLVRPGIALYGIDPGPETPLPATFRPALSLKTRIAQIRVVDAGETVSYGRAWMATSATRIGILPIGYGDGLRRGPSTWGNVLVRGRRAPLVGRVCMDMCMVDLNDSPDARPGDEVVLIGRQGMQSITADDVAHQSGTSAYEVVCQILARVPREVVDPDTGWGT